MIEIMQAEVDEVKDVIRFIDSTFTKEGYGFVTSAQIKSEVLKGRVWVAKDVAKIVGVRIGKERVYNLAVHPDYRRQGIGTRLIMEVFPPETIRVKATPVGHLSKEQRDNFVTPRRFYDKIGFHFKLLDYARNFWQRASSKAQFHKQGKEKHIEVWERNK